MSFYEGLEVTGGLTIFDFGLKIKSGGLTVVGGTFLSSMYTVTSDKRLKENISTIDQSLYKISKLRGVFYDWTAHGKNLVGNDFN